MHEHFVDELVKIASTTAGALPSSTQTPSKKNRAAMDYTRGSLSGAVPGAFLGSLLAASPKSKAKAARIGAAAGATLGAIETHQARKRKQRAPRLVIRLAPMEKKSSFRLVSPKPMSRARSFLSRGLAKIRKPRSALTVRNASTGPAIRTSQNTGVRKIQNLVSPMKKSTNTVGGVQGMVT